MKDPLLHQNFEEALQNREFYLLYQPRLDLKSGQMVGIEVLIRWNHPTRGVLLPGEFMRLAEEKGFILPLEEWVLKTACMQLQQWHQEKAFASAPPSLSINISNQQLIQRHFAEKIEAILGAQGLKVTDLELDLYETACKSNFQAGRAAIQQLNQLGLSVAIDHFGLENLSLEELQALPVQRLKIDRSFIAGLPEVTDIAIRVQEIVLLARELKMKSVATGVESPSQYRWVQHYGFDELQGFYYSRPLSASNLLQQYDRLQRFSEEALK